MTYAEIKPYVASVRLFEDGTAHWRVYERGINGFTAEYKLAAVSPLCGICLSQRYLRHLL